MKRKLLLVAGLAICVSIQVDAQTKLVEKVTRKGDELVIPYDKKMNPKAKN
jgi:zinc protease